MNELGEDTLVLETWGTWPNSPSVVPSVPVEVLRVGRAGILSSGLTQALVEAFHGFHTRTVSDITRM